MLASEPMSVKKTLTFRLLTLFIGVAIAACIFSIMKPFTADVVMELVSYDPANDVATIKITDKSLLGRLILMRPNDEPIVSLIGADSRSESRVSSTADWRQIPHEQFHFATPSLWNLKSPVTVSIQVKSRFSDSLEWVSLTIDKSDGKAIEQATKDR